MVKTPHRGRPSGTMAGADFSGVSAAILDALPIGLYVVDRDLRIQAWNRLRERGVYGKPREQVLGKHLRSVLPAQGYRATLPVLKRIFETGLPHQETTETPGKRVFRIRRLPVHRGRRITHILSWFEDITEQRALELQLIASDRLAFLGQLVAGVAHEVSNPLAGIAGCAEVLSSLAAKAGDASSRQEAHEFRDLIRSEVARCERIVRSLLDAARPSQGTATHIDTTVETVLRLLDRHPAFTRVRVASRMPKGLPAARIDPDSLKQVVLALAVNAARAMAGGGRLTLRGGRSGPSLTLDVMDTGPGVPPAIRSRIFEPYFTTEPTRGTGLGLAIARSLVRGQGGDLVYRPRRGAGAAFRVILEPVEGGA